MNHTPVQTANNSRSYADIALNLPLNNSYQYAVPNELRSTIDIGSLVKVNFNKRILTGCVTGFCEEKKCSRPKNILSPITPGFKIDRELMNLAYWISEYYFCSPGEALSCVSFIGFNDIRKHKERYLKLIMPEILDKGKIPETFPRRQKDVLLHFLEKKNVEEKLSSIVKNLKISNSVIQSLVKKNIFEITEHVVERKDEYARPLNTVSPLLLNKHQKTAFDQVKKVINDSTYRTFLLNGVTGSGKTEIYLQALSEALEMGKQGIVLVPEIALTPQTVERFRGRFGEKIGVYHSQLSLGQKYDMWRSIKAGIIQCLVGARSAVFAPFPKLGIIVVDEEHESTYKQNDTPRYHARDMAILRGSRIGAAVILGSATPSLESWYNTVNKKYSLLSLPERVSNYPMPSVELVDMGKELSDKKSTGIFSSRLAAALGKRINSGEQVILFLNRRGFSNFILCPGCNQAIKCDHCDVTLTYHKAGDRLVCHYCGVTKKVPETCPNCKHENMMRLGMGTQRLEEELESIYPGARIMRLDSDTLGGRKTFIKKWNAITAGEVDILFGTQILAKGFDLEPVTLVGVISADNSLFLPDFRSAERTFSLLTQVAGRAGRGSRPGEVIIQTYLPKHYSIVDALTQNYSLFAEKELKNRKALRFPPYARLISILFSGKDQKLTAERIRRFGNLLRLFRTQFRKKQVTILGPAASPIGKLGDRYRYRIILRGEKTSEMRQIIKAALEKFNSLKLKKNIRISVDVDPQDLL
jgi:primosomal protein N' (replication factor Y) (superfamily II helicase)